MRNHIFFIPLLYTYNTRLRNFTKTMSLVIIYFIPVIYLMVIEGHEILPFKDIILLGCFAVICLYNVYEIGYIQNDTETIRIDNSPTVRLLPENLNYYEKHKTIIYIERLFLSFMFALLMFFLIGNNKAYILFEISLIIILLLYQLYNRVRCQILVINYFLLISIRYISPLLLFLDKLSIELVLTALMIFPIVKTICFKGDNPGNYIYSLWFRKYILRNNTEKLTEYRVIAYTIMFIVSLGLYLIHIISIYCIIPILYMLFYRFIIWMAILAGFKPFGYLKG
ncbi:hypothetical protein FACS1894137_12350 [Spirochaetia bacterium]|nr:hypothetical protein FACS1894137_12350 [Spirochaetia bacterium]